MYRRKKYTEYHKREESRHMQRKAIIITDNSAVQTMKQVGLGLMPFNFHTNQPSLICPENLLSQFLAKNKKQPF